MSLSERAEQQGRYDSVVANAGQMARHPYGQQIHREFIVYNKAKVYPDFHSEYSNTSASANEGECILNPEHYPLYPKP